MKQLMHAFLAFSFIAASCQVNYEKTKSGLKYKLYKGKGAKLEPGKFVKFNVEYKIQGKDSILNTTYGKIPGYTKIDTSAKATYSFVEILPKSNVGDSIVFIMSIDSLKNKGMIPGYDNVFHKGDQITGKLKIIAQFANEQAVMQDYQNEMTGLKQKEITAIESYLKKNNIKAQKTTNGVFVEITQNGTGEKVNSGKQVSVMYKGYLMDNKKAFDGNMDSSFGHTEPYKLVLGSRGVIPGWEEGLRYFTNASKGRIYIPSSMAYGAQGNPPVIPPFSNLIFDIAIVDVAEAPKQTEQPKPPVPINK